MKQHRKLKGFTLMEMIIVLAIMGVLIGILAPTMSTYYWKSRVKDANADAKMVYNAAQTAVQRYISIDRMKTDFYLTNPTADNKSRFSPYFLQDLIIDYDATTRVFTLKSVDGTTTTPSTSDILSASVDEAIDKTSHDEKVLYQRVVSDILKTVSDADMTNWAIYVDGYIVKSAVSANSQGTRNVGYYTNGTITVERAAGSYKDQHVDLLCGYARNEYEQDVHPPVLTTEAPVGS